MRGSIIRKCFGEEKKSSLLLYFYKDVLYGQTVVSSANYILPLTSIRSLIVFKLHYGRNVVMESRTGGGRIRSVPLLSLLWLQSCHDVSSASRLYVQLWLQLQQQSCDRELLLFLFCVCVANGRAFL